MRTDLGGDSQGKSLQGGEFQAESWLAKRNLSKDVGKEHSGARGLLAPKL